MRCKKNDEIELHITDLTSEGAGIGKIDGYPFFVKGAIPGDIIRAGVTKVKKTYGYARLIEVLTPSSDRVTPPCPEAHRCGGCQLQHMSYEAQLQFKQKKVSDALTRIGGFEVTGDKGDGSECHLNPKVTFRTVPFVTERVSVPVPLTHPAPATRYRNKIQVPFGTDRDGNMVYGFYAGRTHAIVPMDDCIAGFPEAAEILKSIRDDCVAHDIPAYDETTGEGILRHVLLRKAFATGEIQVCLVVNCEPAGESAGTGTLTHFSAGSEQSISLNEKRVSVPVPLTHQIPVTFGPVPFVTSLSLNYNPARTNVILGPETVTIYGKPYIEDILCGLTFRIAAPSFYQVNPAVTELLYEKVVECVSVPVSLTHPSVIWDLYCGIGTISLVLAHRLRTAHVHGVEVVPEAIDNARENACINGIDNATFYVGKAEDIAPTLPRPDVIVVDPPRKGCDAALLQTILGARPKRIVYVSCDPATLARDLKTLTADGSYCLTTVQPFDMFPMTYHVECVTLLQRMSNTRERTITLDVEMEDYHRIKNRTEVTADATE